eukprot:356921-Chlamydomonas_euryale.AAC.4
MRHFFPSHPLLNPVPTLPRPTADDKGSLQLQNAKGQVGGSGELEVVSFSVEVRPSFLDYLQSGAEINFMVGVVSDRLAVL